MYVSMLFIHKTDVVLFFFFGSVELGDGEVKRAITLLRICKYTVFFFGICNVSVFSSMKISILLKN